MITSKKAHELVVREYRPAFQWNPDEVLDALRDCEKNHDVVGASALFGRLNQEHKAFFGFDFRDRRSDSPLPETDTQEAVVLNCARAAQYYELIRAQAA